MVSKHFSLKNTIAVVLLIFIYTGSFSQYVNSTPADAKKDTAKKQVPGGGKNIIGFGIFSLLNQHVSFQYDRQISESIIFTGQAGILVNITSNPNATSPSGGFLEGGIKLFVRPDYINDHTHLYNTMQGFYFKPQFVISIFDLSNTQTYGYSTYNSYGVRTQTVVTTYTGAALLLNFGRQWVVNRSLTFDIYFGLGYALNNLNKVNYPVSNYYSYEASGGGGTPPLAFAAGTNIGILF